MKFEDKVVIRNKIKSVLEQAGLINSDKLTVLADVYHDCCKEINKQHLKERMTAKEPEDDKI